MELWSFISNLLAALGNFVQQTQSTRRIATRSPFTKTLFRFDFVKLMSGNFHP